MNLRCDTFLLWCAPLLFATNSHSSVTALYYFILELFIESTAFCDSDARAAEIKYIPVKCLKHRQHSPNSNNVIVTDVYQKLWFKSARNIKPGNYLSISCTAEWLWDHEMEIFCFGLNQSDLFQRVLFITVCSRRAAKGSVSCGIAICIFATR